MNLIDTHCHIHDTEFFSDQAASDAYDSAKQAGIESMLLIGTDLISSQQAVTFAGSHDGCYAALGVHPHEAHKLSAEDRAQQVMQLEALAKHKKVVAIGECGFDFYYNDKKDCYDLQLDLLERQLQLAVDRDLPVSFHVREAFDEFWPVFDNFPGLKGVLHSFTDREKQVKAGLKRNLYFGINGIATFTSHSWQRRIFHDLPLENMLLETDAPFLTPNPRRGTINTPENVIYITRFLAELRGEDAKHIAETTTKNARKLFELS